MSYMDDFLHLQIQLDDIKAATNNFSDRPIGTGGFGAVYKGELLLPKGRRTVAFKRLDRKFGQGDVEFWKEITMLSELRHENLASLLHFCREGNERILVYEYASRRSLDRYLDKASLTWIQRLQICIGAARGIAYLHDPKKTQQRVVHRDIKSSNILLDDKWTAKVSDFGLSKITPANQPRTYVVSNAVGTPGYCDPAYHETGILSKECDVYSFGVVLFEVMCGRLCCEYNEDKLLVILVHTWKNHYSEDRLLDIVFPDLKQQINQDSLSTFAAIAMRCLNRNNKKRPNMVEVVKELELALDHQQNFKQYKAIVAKTPTSYRFMEEFDHLKVPLEDVKLATNNFSKDRVIGVGGFGRVYKGELSLPGGQSMVAIKRLDRRLWQGSGEFLNEITVLSKYKHENLVSLLNFCIDGDEMILVYNYASRGSLDRYLSEPGLTWTQRLQICIGVASAINYLHDPPNKELRILHRDIKSSNILLNEDWTPKVSDFVLSKLVSADVLNSNLLFDQPCGSFGYSDPVYMETGFLSKASDVYSFGVVLFEILCGILVFGNSKQVGMLVHKWIRCYDEKKLDEIIFSDLKEQMDSCSLNTFSTTAYRSLKRDPKERPTMAEVVKALKTALEQQEEFEETMRIQNLVIFPISNTSARDTNFMQFPIGVLVGDGNTYSTQYKATVAKTPTSYRFMEEFDHLKVPLEDILLATNNFSDDHFIARSEFGRVYKGELSLPGGQSMVCIKRLDRRLGQGGVDFWNEITILSKYKHENLVSLLNFCIDGDEMILVYNYASRGSLDRYLSEPGLTWTQRLQICIGVSSAMNYLHDPPNKELRVLHRDIKSSNILLDEDWTAKVSDFGLSKLVSADELNSNLFFDQPCGSFGYSDPVYMETGFLSKASDVYSFGVVLFEILCGRLVEIESGKQVDMLVPKWIRCYDEKKLDEIIFSDLKEQMDSCSLNTFSSIAYRSLKRDPEERPTMAEVVKALVIALEQQEEFEETMRILNLVISPISNTSARDQQFMQFPKGVLVGDGNTWLSKFKNGKMCEVISATKCIFADSFVHDNTQNSRFSNVMKGGLYNGFRVKVTTQLLSPKAMYAVNLVFKHKRRDHEAHIPFKFKVGEEGYYSNSCVTRVRDDGWLMLEMCQFTSCKREHDLEVNFLPLFNITSSGIDYFLEGVEFRPVQYVS